MADYPVKSGYFIKLADDNEIVMESKPDWAQKQWQ
jgi:hypothetical protein